MKLVKVLIPLIILCLLGIFIYQNLAVWEHSENLRYNLYVVKPAHDVKIYVLLLTALVLGFFAGLAVMMKFHFTTRRKLKRERLEKQQAQAALTQKLVNPAAAASSVSNAAQSPVGNEGQS